MTAVLLGLLIAASFGSGDFAGGRASKSTSAFAVLVVAQACSVFGALGLVLAVHGEVRAHDVLYGAAAGAINVVGLALLYAGIARHATAVVAPVAAVVGSTIPVAWGFAQGERPTGSVVAGITLAVVAGALIAAEPSEGIGVRAAAGVLPAVGAGLAFGTSLILYSETARDSGQWPVAAGRIAALTTALVVFVVIARREQVRLPAARDRLLALGAGGLDVAATALLVVAVRRVLLVVVAPIAALGPAFTVVLAWLLDRERLRRVQALGVVVALVALALISRG